MNVRLQNLRNLESILGGRSKLAQLTGVEYAQFTAYIGKNPKRNIGEKFARKIENKLIENNIKNMFIGYLDQQHSSDNIIEKSSLIPLGAPVPLPVPSVQSVFGNKCNLKNEGDNRMLDEVLIDTMKELSLEHKNAFWLKVIDDSMKPYIEPGTLTMIDKGRREILEGSCYALEIDKNVVLRRIYKENGAYKICCDNPALKIRIRDKTVHNFKDEGVHILGKLIWSATAHY